MYPNDPTKRPGPRPALGARFVAVGDLLAGPGLLMGQAEPGGGRLRRAHRQTTVQFEPAPAAIATVPQARRVGMGRVSHLRRILQEEHRLRAGGRRPRLRPVGRTQGGMGDIGRVEQAVGRLQVGPRLRLGGQTGRGVGSQCRAHAHGSRGAAVVAQRGLCPLRAGPLVKIGEGRGVQTFSLSGSPKCG